MGFARVLNKILKLLSDNLPAYEIAAVELDPLRLASPMNSEFGAPKCRTSGGVWGFGKPSHKVFGGFWMPRV